MDNFNVSNFRVYVRSYHPSLEILQSVKSPDEVHVVVVFARDYDSTGMNTRGEFRAYFDNSKFTSLAIDEFKRNSINNVKFFLSIGGRSSDYPFTVNANERIEWTRKAVESLKGIIQQYNFDGIDVYYESINSDSELFASAIGNVIDELKRQNVITRASITVPAPLNDNFYSSIFQDTRNLIDTVVYQCHTQRINVARELVHIVSELGYPRDKLFAGHSSVQPRDRTNLPLPLFRDAVPDLLKVNGGCVSGISKWIATYDKGPEM